MNENKVKYFVEKPQDEYGNTCYPRCIIATTVEKHFDPRFQQEDNDSLIILAPEDFKGKWSRVSRRYFMEVEATEAKDLTRQEWQQYTGYIKGESVADWNDRVFGDNQQSAKSIISGSLVKERSFRPYPIVGHIGSGKTPALCAIAMELFGKEKSEPRGTNTLYSECFNRLYNSGLFEDQAKSVMEMAMNSEASEPLKDRWNDDISKYPDMMVNVAWMTVKYSAREWIEKNLPDAWFRPMFEQ